MHLPPLKRHPAYSHGCAALNDYNDRPVRRDKRFRILKEALLVSQTGSVSRLCHQT